MYDLSYAVFWESQTYRDSKQQLPGAERVGGGNASKGHREGSRVLECFAT